MAIALSKAYSTLNDLPPEYGRMILVITDMTRTPWDGFSAAELDILDRDVKLKIVGLGGSEGSPNGYIKNISFGRATVGAPLPIEVELQNPASMPGKDLQAELEVSGETVQRRFLKASPGESSRVHFEYVARSPGLLEAELRISEDRLTDDDVHYFIIPVRDKIDVLVVDGDPKTSLLQSEVYYLTNALQPGPDEEQSPISPKVVTISRFNSMDRHEADAIILANVNKIDREARLRLMDYVVGGGSLIFYLGDRVAPDRYNKIFHDSATRLLPVRLKEAQEAPARLWRINHIDLTHPALESFEGREGESLLRAQFNKVFEVEEGTLGDARVLLALDNGMPLLMERKIGRGKVLLFTSTADRDWNDLCVRGAYLPLVQALIGYVTTENFQPPPTAGRAGQPVSIAVKETVAETTTEVEGPDKNIIPGVVSREGGKAVLNFEGQAPGIYNARVGGEYLRLALNTSKEESNLTHITEAELKGKFEGAEIDVITGAVDAAGILRERGKTVILSSALALMMFLFLAAEGVIANKT